MRTDLITCHNLQNDLSQLRADKATLEERCASKEIFLRDLEQQVPGLREKEKADGEKLAQLQVELGQLKLRVQVQGESLARLHELEQKITTANQQLGRSQEDLRAEKQKLENLQDIETTLKNRVQDLEQQLQDWATKSSNEEAIRAEEKLLVCAHVKTFLVEANTT
jgi:predicted  nucleic acid-binding Zn-ribbon protein